MSDENFGPAEEAKTGFDVGDATHVERRKRKIKIDDNKANLCIRGLMAEPEGRAFFWWLLEVCHVHQSSFHQNGLAMAFKEGERNVGLQIEARIIAAASADDFSLMQKEAREKEDA